MDDVLGKAIYSFHNGITAHKLWINNKYGAPEEMPVETYFRSEEDMPDLEYLALEQCSGKVLDIGAGAGSHALQLQANAMAVTALDISPLAVQVMHQRGVKQAVQGDIFGFEDGKFDTLLLLMNGIGLAGTIENLKLLLTHLKDLIKPNGVILFDSSDIAYLYENRLPAEHYYGEIEYQYSYNNDHGDWFKWLYIDEHTMQKIAAGCGFNMEVLMEDEQGQYLAKLTSF